MPMELVNVAAKQSMSGQFVTHLLQYCSISNKKLEMNLYLFNSPHCLWTYVKPAASERSKCFKVT